jgi:DNA-directed RNA polymerase subunit H
LKIYEFIRIPKENFSVQIKIYLYIEIGGRCIRICISYFIFIYNCWVSEVEDLSAEKKTVKITDHLYQPKHEILPKPDASAVLKQYNAKPSQLPYILLSDKGLQDLDVRPGDIIKITRKSATSGESVYYRYVVEG